MSWVTRITNVLRRERLVQDLDEELASHIEEAVERGRSPEEARRALGRTIAHREASRDIKVFPWLESLLADIAFGWRQLAKHRAVNIIAILSLALATGAITGVFRLVEAVLLRPLPIASPESLHYLEVSSREGYREDFSYPQFRAYKSLLEDQADLLLVGSSAQQDVSFGVEEERFYRQYVSGNVFGLFGLQPAAGRLLTPGDDLQPGGHPVAVLSYDYWTRRFGGDSQVVGKGFRYGDRLYQVVGVAPKGFVGTEPGIIADAFVPAVMNTAALDSVGWSWFRIWLRAKPGVPLEDIRQRLQAAVTREREEEIQGWTAGTTQERIDAHLSARVRLPAAAAGASDLQRQYRESLLILTVLAGLVLLIACANVANLRIAQAMAREREMALRVSIGAGRRRLVQMVLVESAIAAVFASILGVLFAWYAVPYVVSMLTPPQNPVRLVLDPDWKMLGFVVAVAVSVTVFCGLAPAIRASSVRPVDTLKIGPATVSHRRVMNSILAAQVSFCVLVLFIGGLFLATFHRLSNQYLGFSPDNVFVLEAESTTGKLPPEALAQVASHLRQLPGMKSAAFAGWPLMSGNRWTVGVQVDGRPAEISPLALDVSAGFFETMEIAWLDGRDFRPGDQPPRLAEDGRPIGGVTIVNESFAQYFFQGQNPIGRTILVYVDKEVVAPLEIIGYVGDARYRNLREPLRPALYVPVSERSHGALLARATGDSPAVAALLRREAPRARPGIRVRNVATQMEFVRRHSIRERLLATLSLFFVATALALAGMGLYSVLNYSIVRRRREIGIRMALGARSADITRRVITQAAMPFWIGSMIGIGCGLACEKYFQALLFEVTGTDPRMLVLPVAALLIAALIAALEPALQAVKIDPAVTLRSE